ncbi:BTAD domain-containing putative transcriptional regulator [Dactylosporangium sp. CA-092794]|uniref:AfsR/SARP family transcriptional regulator n=1 Tax=Dactylosporangium sp. CA-092794 TaxID=3239929 RepID=UPI003D936BFF
MDFVILGPTALYDDGRPVPLGAAKQRGMLAVLLYHAGEPVRTDEIIEHLWADRTRVDRRMNLYTLTSRIRATLGAAGLPGALHRVPGIGAYRLDVDRGRVDFHRFAELVAQGRTAAQEGRPEEAVRILENAIALWRSEPLADLRTAPAEHLRRSMNATLLTARKLLAANRLRTGQHHRVLLDLETVIRGEETDETLAQLWISALSAAGRDPEARLFLHDFRRRYRRHMHAEPAVALPAVPPPKPPPAKPPGQLPKDVAGFVGRADLLAELDALTGSGGAGVVAISGMPGVGKTGLAVHWAHLRAARFPDGQLYLDGNAYGPAAPVDPEEALGRFLDVLGVPADRMPAGLEPRRNRFNQLLAGRRVLVVLDNVRHSGQVRPLIPTPPECLTIVTSRTRLRGLTVRDGAPDLTVGPLPDADSLALLARTIGTRRADAEPAALAALAHRCAGLPLALRIVAVQVAERPRVALADLVDEVGAHLLDGDETEDDEREASLRSVFAWPYRALTPVAARLFRLLGLHPGTSIAPPAAAALLGVGVEQAELLLNALAKTNLVSHDVARHYRLHDLLRAFAADRAAAEDPPARTREALRRLLDWYLLSGAAAVKVLAPDRPSVPDLPTPADVNPQAFTTDAEALAWCEAERENLAAAGLWATRNGHDRHGWQLPEVLVELFLRRGHQEELLPLLRSALGAAERDGHEIAQVGTLNNLGATRFSLHDLAGAAAAFGRALALARRIGYTEAETVCLNNLAAVHLSNGEAALAARLLGDVLAACRAVGHLNGEAAALHKLGDALLQTGEHAAAGEHYRRALAIRERLGSLRDQGATHRALAALHLAVADPARARPHAARAVDAHTRTRDDPGLCDDLVTLADVERALDRPAESVRAARRAERIAAGLGDHRRRAAALTALAESLAAAGEGPAAHAARAEAQALLAEL